MNQHVKYPGYIVMWILTTVLISDDFCGLCASLYASMTLQLEGSCTNFGYTSWFRTFYWPKLDERECQSKKTLKLTYFPLCVRVWGGSLLLNDTILKFNDINFLFQISSITKFCSNRLELSLNDFLSFKNFHIWTFSINVETQNHEFWWKKKDIIFLF